MGESGDGLEQCERGDEQLVAEEQDSISRVQNADGKDGFGFQTH